MNCGRDSLRSSATIINGCSQKRCALGSRFWRPTSNPLSLCAKREGKLPDGVSPLFWRSGRDSNPRVVAHKLISSQPRYDRFDTAAYLLNSHRSINAKFHYSLSAVMRGPVMSCCGTRNFLLGFCLHKISTAVTPFCSLHPPPAALANVPTSITLRMSAYFSLLIIAYFYRRCNLKLEEYAWFFFMVQENFPTTAQLSRKSVNGFWSHKTSVVPKIAGDSCFPAAATSTES